MANRYDDRQQGGNYRQEEQFQSERDRQFGEIARPQSERGYGERSYGGSDAGYGSSSRDRGQSEGFRNREYRSGRSDPFRDYEGSDYRAGNGDGYGAQGGGGNHATFRGDDYGAGNLTGGMFAGGPSRYGNEGGGYDRSRNERSRQRNSSDRGFFERAGDEIASWFGDDEAERRREQDHRGRGPANYTRSNERILEEACDRLTDDRGVDARNITVTVDQGEVTLDGKVNTRWEKRRAEDCVHDLSGVKHVQNNLRIEQTEMRAGEDPVVGSRSS